MEASIRLGKISSINYESGKARVTYEDRDQAVSAELPFLAWIYRMPEISDLVAVACFSNGSVSGVILGPVYGAANTPYLGAEGRCSIEMASTKNEAVLQYDEKTKKVTIRGPQIELEAYTSGAKITAEKVSETMTEVDACKKDIESVQNSVGADSSKKNIQEQINDLDKRLKAIGG